MTPPLISVVMTTYNRPIQLAVTLASIIKQSVPDLEIIVIDDGDDTRTPKLCVPLADQGYLRYLRLHRPHGHAHLNSGPVANIGLRLAQGEWILLQNAECVHIDPNLIRGLLNRATSSRNAIFARVVALTEGGVESTLYCGTENPRPYFFCGLLARQVFLNLGGFDEDYTSYGYEDDDFADRLYRFGITFEFTNLLVHHQWHPPAGLGAEDMAAMRERFERKQTEGIVRNVGRAWGQL